MYFLQMMVDVEMYGKSWCMKSKMVVLVVGKAVTGIILVLGFCVFQGSFYIDSTSALHAEDHGFDSHSLHFTCRFLVHQQQLCLIYTVFTL